MSAETLRRAAAAMRTDHGTGAREGYDPRWLAVADLLDFEASMPELPKTRAQALAVAHAYLGSDDA